MTQATTQAAIMAVREAETPPNTTKPAPALPKTGGLVLQQPTCHWKATDNYIELCNFETEVKNTILTNS